MRNVKNESGRYSFEVGPIRPPNEGGNHSLLVRATRNCSWNRCAFCPYYRGKEFQIRSFEEVRRDIDAVKRIKDLLCSGGSVEKVPFRCLSLVRNWVRSGGRTAFLQDSNSLIMPTDDLVGILKYLSDTFSSLERITSYARSDTVLRKGLDELERIREAGLVRLHVGLESGNDEVLSLVDKGVDVEDHVKGGKKAIEAGFELSEYVMPGLGGKYLSEEHARDTAEALNEIDPDYIRMRPLSLHPNSELKKLSDQGEFRVNSPHERLEEIKIMLKELDVSSRICFDHSWNSWRNEAGGSLFDLDYEGYSLPEKKDHLLELVEEGLEVDESKHIRAGIRSF